MPRVIHFELSAQQPERAIQFYSDVFGWSASKWDGPEPYWMLTTGDDSKPGINGGGFLCSEFLPEKTEGHGLTVNTIDVPSVDEYLSKITAHGGTIVHPKMAIPGVGHMAYCKDTEGVVFGIIQMDQSVQK